MSVLFSFPLPQKALSLLFLIWLKAGIVVEEPYLRGISNLKGLTQILSFFWALKRPSQGSESSLRLLSHTSDIFSVLARGRRSPCLPDAAQLPMAGGPWQLAGQATAQVPLEFPLCRIQSQEFSELQNYPGCRLLQNWRWASSCSWGDMQPLAAGDSIDRPLILLRQGFVTHRHRVCPSW